MRLYDLGRTIFAVSIAFFGAQYLVDGRFVDGLPPGQSWTPHLPLIAYAFGVALLVSGLAMLRARWVRPAAIAAAILMLAGALLVNAVHVQTVTLHMVARTNAFQAIAYGAIALALSGFYRPGRVLFGISLFVFGLQHFMYPAFIASLLPPWVPAHLALVYASGLGFMAAGVAIALDLRARLAGMLLAVMLLLFVVLVQVPPMLPQPRSGDLWSSLFEALAICAGGLIVAGVPKRRRA